MEFHALCVCVCVWRSPFQTKSFILNLPFISPPPLLPLCFLFGGGLHNKYKEKSRIRPFKSIRNPSSEVCSSLAGRKNSDPAFLYNLKYSIQLEWFASIDQSIFALKNNSQEANEMRFLEHGVGYLKSTMMQCNDYRKMVQVEGIRSYIFLLEGVLMFYPEYLWKTGRVLSTNRNEN